MDVTVRLSFTNSIPPAWIKRFTKINFNRCQQLTLITNDMVNPWKETTQLSICITYKAKMGTSL